jgi:hypothetical protein
MMRLGQRASLLVVCLLLTSAAMASAECAWVLWEHRVTPSKEGSPTESWLAQEAVETRPVCEAKTEALIQRLVQPRASGSLHNYERIGDSKGVTMYQGRKEQGVYQTSDFRCLPDTVDPRGPKTK